MDYGPLFEHIEPKYHGSVTNFFLEPVRRGVTDPEQIVLYVLAKQARSFARPGTGREQFALALATEGAEEGLLALARWALWWEGLHPAVRAEIKAARRQPFVEAWRAGQ